MIFYSPSNKKRSVDFEVCDNSSEEDGEDHLYMTQSSETYLEYHHKNTIKGLSNFSNLLSLKIACKNIKKI